MPAPAEDTARMNAPAGPGLEVRLLGRFAVRRAGQEVAPAAFGGAWSRPSSASW
jgi:hypothetical protein